VERLPMAGYHRIGDSFADDKLTFFSDDSAGGLRFQQTRATLREQGFGPGVSPGTPSLGTTGINPDVTWRGDFRQEIDFPLTAGQFRVTPYVIGRYTQYSNSPTSSEQARLFAGAGARVTTSFWKVDPTAQSDLFDVHQLRHIIQPELNLFTSATTVDRQKLFLYEEPVDAINDVSVAEVGVRQRWQTKRGGPGNWRNVDLFSLDLEADFYANKPNRKTLDPYDFRGLFFPTLPEASIPRDALSLNASWRISDNTVVLGDAQYNLDASKLATAAIGVLVRRDVAVSYYLGNRYIGDLNSNITSFQIDYQINPKYTIDFSQDFDFGLGKNVTSSLAIIRRFDRFFVLVRVFHEQVTGQSGIGFSLFPEGLGLGIDSSRFSGPFQR
jgi:hypothetical protein